MKTEELKAQGLTEEQISFVMAENGKDLKKLQKENDNLTSDRDTWKEKAEAAETTLKGFEGVDLETMQKELSDWKQKATEAEKSAQAQLYERDFADALKTEFEGIKFSSEAAKRAIMAEVKEAGLKLKDGKILGLNDLIGQMKEKDASAFIDDAQQQAQRNMARFTAPLGKQNAPGTMTRKDIEAIKDPSERQSAIASNLHLFGKGEQ
ncbi:phage scaffolding protein [Enterocloster aldenensis]|uniref:phage scaffolding protein n=1 Tax=Enterocloster aldenensis TaxID=358742 RepID=UPI003516CEB8